MGYRVTWTVPMYVIEQGWAVARERFIIQLDYNLNVAARQIESYARGNHPWQNITGDAERLFSVEMVGGHEKMTMEHGVPYGKFLESMAGGKWGIIPRSFTYGKPIVQRELQRSLDQSYGMAR